MFIVFMCVFLRACAWAYECYLENKKEIRNYERQYCRL